MNNRLVQKIIVLLILIGICSSPFVFSTEYGDPVQFATAQAFGDPMGIGEKLIPNGLFSEENREEVEESLKRGIAACAIATALSILISVAFTKVNISNFAQEFKDNFLDCVVYHVINALIEDMLRSLTRWVQTGMKGNPVFVTNVNKSALQIADEQFGSYIAKKFDGTVPFFCSPFKAQLRIQLLEIYRDSRGFNGQGCTLTGALSNSPLMNAYLNGEGFIEGGGWNTWKEIVENPKNHPYGAYFAARDELALQIGSGQTAFEKKIDLGRGFFGVETQQCYATIPSDDGGTEDVPIEEEQIGNYFDAIEYFCDEPQIVTPGAFLEGQLEKKFGIPGDRLTFGDELNELINAVTMLLVDNIFGTRKKKDDNTPPVGLAGYDFDSQKNYTFGPPDISGGGGGSACQAVSTDNDAAAPGETIVYEALSEPFTSTAEDITRELYFGADQKNKRYTKLTVHMDVVAGEFTQLPGSANFHQIFYLTRGDEFWNQVIGSVGIKRGSEQKIVSWQHFAGVCNEAQSQFVPAPGDRFHVEYVYDTEGGYAGTEITGPDGQRINGAWKNSVAPIIDSNDNGFHISVGGKQDDGGEYQVAAIGWTFSNLRVEVSYGGETGGAPNEGGNGGGGNNFPPRDGTAPNTGGGTGNTGGGEHQDPPANPAWDH